MAAIAVAPTPATLATAVPVGSCGPVGPTAPYGVCQVTPVPVEMSTCPAVEPLGLTLAAVIAPSGTVCASGAVLTLATGGLSPSPVVPARKLASSSRVTMPFGQ